MNNILNLIRILLALSMFVYVDLQLYKGNLNWEILILIALLIVLIIPFKEFNVFHLLSGKLK